MPAKAANLIVEVTTEPFAGRRQFRPGRNRGDVPIGPRAARRTGHVPIERLHHSEDEFRHMRAPRWQVSPRLETARDPRGSADGRVILCDSMRYARGR